MVTFGLKTSKGITRHGTFFGGAVFFILTGLSFWFPGRYYNFLPLLVSFMATGYYIFAGGWDRLRMQPVTAVILFYGLLILISSGMHLTALAALNPSTSITVRPHDTRWGIMIGKTYGAAYLLFPLFLIILIHYFHIPGSSPRMLTYIPLLFIPSMLLGAYQRLFDIGFLNPTITVWLREITGLSRDFNGFRLSLFLLFPLTVLGVTIHRRVYVKIGFFLFMLATLLMLILSRSRTGLFGAILFSFLFPAVAIWVYHGGRKAWTRFLLTVLVFFTIFGIIAIRYVTVRYPDLSVMGKIQEKYAYFNKYGLVKTIAASFDEKSFIRSKAPSRVEMGYYALKLIARSPLGGWGPGGFIRKIDNIRYEDIRKVQYQHFDNANNQYLQIGVDLGLIGTVPYIILHIFPLWMIFRIRNRIYDQKIRWTAGISFSVVCILLTLNLTGPHTLNVEVLWILSCYLAFLYASALKFGYVLNLNHLKWVMIVSVLLLVVFAIQSFDKTYGDNGYQSMRMSAWWPMGAEQNHYPIENWKEGSVIWCGQDAVIELPVENKVPENVTLKMLAMHPDVGIRPVTVKYGGKTGPKHTMIMHDRLWKTIHIPITQDYVVERNNPQKGFQITESLIFSFDVSRTWVPKKWGVNDDTRELGVAVMMPQLSQNKVQKSSTRRISEM